MRRARRGGLIGLAGMLVLLVVFTAGVFVDQTFPEYVPLLRVGAPPQGQVDRATMDQAFRIIQTRYYDPRVNASKLSTTSINGMVQGLDDPFSQYLSPDQYRQQQDQYAGKHPGMIGIYVNFLNGYPVVGGLLPGSPALQAGLQTDDVIVQINGKSTQGLTPDQTSSLIRGPAGTTVAMVVRHGADAPERDVTVHRENFQSPTVQSLRMGDVLYMRIYQFGDSTQQEFDTQLTAGLSGAKGVVLDLRDNGGGFVSAAAAVISRFVSSGEAFEQRARGGAVDRTSVDGNHPAADIPLVVLVNENTASASEIVSGSLQARSRARLVGAKTFGKGSVQVDYQLANGGDLHLTIAHWYLPNGKTIDKTGLTPDVPVALANRQQMFDVVQPARGHAGDAQLNEALSLLGAQ